MVAVDGKIKGVEGMMKKTLRKLSMVLMVVMVMSVFAVQRLAAEVQAINSQSDLVPEIDSKQELRRWWNSWF